MSAPEIGPFRTAEPTVEAQRAKENEASWARVSAATSAAIEAERRRQRRRRLAITAALVLLLVASVGIIGLAIVAGGSWTPFVCPAGGGIAAAIFALVMRGGRSAAFLPPPADGP